MSEHPHTKVIANMDNIASLITILSDSKNAYIKKNLSIHLHPREINLMKLVYKHSKPKHKQARINKYKKIMENPEEAPKKYEMHKQLFLNRYKKLAKKGLVKVNEEPEVDLPYDIELTETGLKLFDEINSLEKQWEEKILINFDKKEELLELLKDITLPALSISYAYQKQQKGVY